MQALLASGHTAKAQLVAQQALEQEPQDCGTLLAAVAAYSVGGTERAAEAVQLARCPSGTVSGIFSMDCTCLYRDVLFMTIQRCFNVTVAMLSADRSKHVMHILCSASGSPCIASSG